MGNFRSISIVRENRKINKQIKAAKVILISEPAPTFEFSNSDSAI